VRHRAGGRGEIVQQGIGAEELDRVADAGLGVAEVEGQEVHVDDQQGAPRAADPGVAVAAGGADHPVGVAGGDDGDAGGPGQGDVGAVAEALAGLDGADVEDRGGERSHGGEPRVGGLARAAAVEADARADHVEGVGGAEEDPRGGGQAGPGPGEQGAGLGEASELVGVVRVGRIGGGAQVAHHQGDVEAGQAVGGLGQRPGLGQRQALAVHAGVELQGDGERPARAAGEGRGLADLGQGRQRRRQVGGRQARPCAGGEAVEDVDGGRSPGPELGAQGLALVQPGD
jgi:hypothetical protein